MCCLRRVFPQAAPFEATPLPLRLRYTGEASRAPAPTALAMKPTAKHVSTKSVKLTQYTASGEGTWDQSNRPTPAGTENHGL